MPTHSPLLSSDMDDTPSSPVLSQKSTAPLRDNPTVMPPSCEGDYLGSSALSEEYHPPLASYLLPPS